MTINVAFTAPPPAAAPTQEQPLRGTPEELAAAFRRFAREGIGHLQLVLSPSTLASLDDLAPALDVLDRT